MGYYGARAQDAKLLESQRAYVTSVFNTHQVPLCHGKISLPVIKLQCRNPQNFPQIQPTPLTVTGTGKC